MFITILIFTWFLGNDIIYKTSPLSSVDSVVEKAYKYIQLTSNNFPIAIQLADSYGKTLNDEKYLKISAVLDTWTIIDNDYKEIKLALEPCKPEHFPEFPENEFDQSMMKSSLCISQQDINIKGYFPESNVNKLSIDVLLCDYDIDDTCASKSEIERYIADNGVNINLFYYDVSLRLKDEKFPIQKYIYNFFRYISYDKTKFCYYNLMSNYVMTDSNFLMSDYEPKEFQILKLDYCDNRDIDKNYKYVY